MPPVYGFECPYCCEEKELKLPVADYNAPQRCNSCGELMQRTVSRGTSFSLKGESWARDNYGNKRKPERE